MVYYGGSAIYIRVYEEALAVKKTLSVLLAFAMVSIMAAQISVPAFALGDATGSPTRASTLDLHDDAALAALAAEDGVTLTAGVYANAAQGWSYDANAAPKTLTLSGAHIQAASAGDMACGIWLPPGSKIVLADGTANDVSGGGASAGSSSAVFANGDLTIEGGGTLVAMGGNASENSYGIRSYGGAIGIGGGTVTAAGGDASNESAGIIADMDENGQGGAIDISGGAVTATGGAAKGSSGISARGNNAQGGAKIVISGGEVAALGGKSSEYQAFGICAKFGSIAISGTTGKGVSATAGDSGSVSYGIYADANTAGGAGNGRNENDGKITIGGGEVEALGGPAGSSYGIFAVGAIAISECTVNATGGTSTNVGTTGIASEAGGISIGGAATTVNATGGNAKLSPENAEQGGFANSMGVYALGGDVTIDGDAAVNASGGQSESECVCGIHLNKSFQDGSGGKLTIGGNARVKAVGGIVVNMQTAFGGAAFIVGGNADVDVSAADVTEGDIIGISMTNGCLTIGENARVAVRAGNGKYGSYGVRIDFDAESAGGNAGENDGKLIMTGGILEVRSATARNSRAVFAKRDIEISGGTILAQSGTATEEASTGIFSNGKIGIGGTADITAKSGTAPSLSAAVYANGGIALDPAVAVLDPEGGGVSGDGKTISTATGADDDCAGDVHIAAAPAESAAQPEQSPGNDVETAPASGGNANNSMWIIWIVAGVAAALCIGGILLVVRKKKG
jgi:hypothetical protein